MGCGQWVQGTTLRPKFSSLGGFWALLSPTKASYTTPHYYPKYEVWAIEIRLWDDPFKNNSACMAQVWAFQLGIVGTSFTGTVACINHPSWSTPLVCLFFFLVSKSAKDEEHV